LDWERFHQAIIELGVNAGLIMILTPALFIIHRYILMRTDEEG